jgi:hypothetical protein
MVQLGKQRQEKREALFIMGGLRLSFVGQESMQEVMIEKLVI